MIGKGHGKTPMFYFYLNGDLQVFDLCAFLYVHYILPSLSHTQDEKLKP